MVLRRSMSWRSLEHGGLEQLKIEGWADMLQVTSTVTTQVGDQRYGLSYDMSLDSDWTFRSLMVKRTDGAMVILGSDRQGNWKDGKGPRHDLEGCVDVDFEATPFTNTLPIRRLAFTVGDRRRLRMAYVPADTLEPFAYDQIYTRINETTYRFENADGSFAAKITVDEEGFVVTYPGLFERI